MLIFGDLRFVVYCIYNNYIWAFPPLHVGLPKGVGPHLDFPARILKAFLFLKYSSSNIFAEPNQYIFVQNFRQLSFVDDPTLEEEIIKVVSTQA